MSTFKLKTERVRYTPKIKTVDSMHKKFTNKFKKDYDELPDKQNDLKKYTEDIKNIENKDSSLYTNDDIKKRSELKHKIIETEKDIERIKNNKNELDYYCMTENLLMDYYDIVDKYDNPCDNSSENNIKNSKDNIDNKNNTSNSDDDNEKKNNNDCPLERLNNIKKKPRRKLKTPKKKKKIKNTNDILSYFGKDDNSGEELEMNRASILNNFLNLIDTEYGTDNTKKNIFRNCTQCLSEKSLIPNEGIFVCKSCGEVEEIIMEIDRASIKDQSLNKPGYPYKRINHFNEWLSQFQAKESTDIPDFVCNNILKELKKNRVKDFSKLTLPYMKKLLRKLKLTEYYEHIPHIISKINKLPPPTISREMEDELRKLFRDMQEPFEKHKPASRINFLSYSYVLHKLCELLEMDDFLKCFPLLKSRSKLRAQDNMWKKICKECSWEFYPSI